MDVAKAFTYFAEDERWMGKLVIGVLVSLVSILILPGFLLSGYMVGITRNVMNGEKRPLPEWEDLGTLFMDGLSIIVVSIVYTLPFWLITCIAFATTIGFGGLSEATQISDDAVAAGILATWGLVSCLFLIFMLAFFFISPAIVIQYVREGNIGACFRFGEVLAIVRDNFADILIAGLTPFAVSFVFSMVISALNLIICVGTVLGILLSIAMGPYLTAVTGHLYGQIAGKIGGTPPAEKFAL
ncbi:MAG: DUF4013 domain-containing protein [Ardenticatenaceae bacterium]|nr:DUF4013 domain-containing protein [Anaerolineales bacterium]MCB8938577.1 DUF4013 domain-containing protein [Ardenticatenaceae bacterium]MCB8973710.1 DUF4013 domain-containing protein [Ardenticatenaceae bacterium]